MGSRILNHVLLFAAGLILGVLGTVAQQTVLTVGSLQLPSGLIIALVAIACLLTGLRLMNDTRWPAFAAALGVVIPAAVFVFPSEGGSVLIPGNALGYTWIYVPVALAILIVGWPSFRSHRDGPSERDGLAQSTVADVLPHDTGENGVGQSS
jgi:hypothetical protein